MTKRPATKTGDKSYFPTSSPDDSTVPTLSVKTQEDALSDAQKKMKVAMESYQKTGHRVTVKRYAIKQD